MSVPKVTEVDMPVLGRFYMVPTVFHAGWGRTVPIYGPPHDDAEFLNFKEIHWHVDWRFASESFYRHKITTRFQHHNNPSRLLHGVVASRIRCGEPVDKRLKMKRETPPFPKASSVPWLKKLEEAFEFHRLPKCLTCPHRGISLKQMTPDANGVITCTGHGLSWNSRTRFLVRST